ncbi:F-box/WD repeat-containing protein 4 isoform 6-T6 [Dama dama]|uniref:F-box/WD repeat-containing protein 4 isoform X6 n=1 Tax=Dama dama TaxID=30532 RepID=UPI002A369D6F|nr:F-box/WD repeat-containing protein 4 isoform X6 [Dama dama]
MNARCVSSTSSGRPGAWEAAGVRPPPALRSRSTASGVRGGPRPRPAPPHVTRSGMVSPPPGAAAVAAARACVRVGLAPRPLMGSQGGVGPPGNGGPGEGESGETRKLQEEGRAARGKRRKGKGKAGAGQGGKGSGAEGKPEPPQGKEETGLGAEAGPSAGLGKAGERGGSVEEGARRLVRGDEGSAGARKEAKGRDEGKKEEWRVRTGRREDARPARAQGRGGQAWGRLAGTRAAMATAAEEKAAAAAAREPACRPAAGPALLRLPEELLLLIFSYLDMQALGRLAQVCRWLRRFTSCDLLWRRIARASLNSGFTRLGTDLMASVPVKERVKVSQNWRLGRCREGILLKWRCSSFVTGTACCGHFSPLRIWDLNSGQLMTHLGSDFPPGAGVLDVMYESPSTLLSCGYDTYVRYWDLRASARKCVMEWEEPHDSTLYCLQTDGNHLLATGSSYYGVVRLWDRRQRACLHAFPLTSTPLSSPVYCLRFTTRHLYAALSYNLHVLDFQNP